MFDVQGDACPLGSQPYRYWLSRTWDASQPLALVVGINPSTATESADDQMTAFLTELLRDLVGEYRCGGFVLVNCCDFRDSDPNNFKVSFPISSGNDNLDTIRTKLSECGF